LKFKQKVFQKIIRAPEAMSIFITGPIMNEGIELLKQHFQSVELYDGQLPCPRDIIIQKSKIVDALLTHSFDKIDVEILQNKQLKIISQCAVGIDNIDLELAAKNKIVVSHTPNALTNSCADHAFALLLAAARNIVQASLYVLNGNWTFTTMNPFLGCDVWGSTIGVIGPGRIGHAICQRAKGFNMNVLYHGPHEKLDIEGQYVSLENLLKNSDFVVLSCKMNDSTRKLISKKELNLMKKSAILINISRGLVVDTEALMEALENDVIGGAALDVMDPEPVQVDHPILKLKNCIVIPHIASATAPTRIEMAKVCAKAIIDCLNQRTIDFCANPSVYK
jgi:glyoxylate reductase